MQRKKRALDSMPETIRCILSEYLSKNKPCLRSSLSLLILCIKPVDLSAHLIEPKVGNSNLIQNLLLPFLVFHVPLSRPKIAEETEAQINSYPRPENYDKIPEHVRNGSVRDDSRIPVDVPDEKECTGDKKPNLKCSLGAVCFLFLTQHDRLLRGSFDCCTDGAERLAPLERNRALANPNFFLS